MNKTIGIDFDESLPSVSLKEDPCVHRLAHELHIRYQSTINVSIKPTTVDGFETYRFEIDFDDSNIREHALRTTVRDIGEMLLLRYQHSYWLIFEELKDHQKIDLLASIRSRPEVGFAAIDQIGFLCIEHESSGTDFDKSMNRFLDDYFSKL